MFGNIFKKKPKNFIKNLNANTLSFLLSVFLMYPYVTYDKKSIIMMLESFENPQLVFDILKDDLKIFTHLGNDNYFLNLENKIIKETFNYYKIIDDIIIIKD